MTKRPLHSHLGASSSERWCKCPGSVRLSRGVGEHQSVYAAEGTAAHHLLEYCLSHDDDPETMRGWWIGPEGAFKIEPPEKYKPGTWFPIDDTMIDAITVAVEWVREQIEPEDEVFFEVPLEISHLHEDFYGRADIVIYKVRTRTLIVPDYKHGAGVPVEVRGNSQLLYYGYGAATRKHNLGIDKVILGVIQPRCHHKDGPIRLWETTPAELMEHAGILVAAAALAETADAPLNPGPWCQWCPSAHFCPALRSRVYELILADVSKSGVLHLPDPSTLSAEQRLQIFKHRGLIEDFLKRVYQFENHEANAGRKLPGLKLVHGRGSREFKSEADARIYMALQGIGLEEMFTEPKFVSPAQAEKLMPAKHKKTPAWLDLIDTVPGNTILVPDDDPRPAVAPSAQAEFGVVE